MLDGIDSIDWASLQHAYGSAADVPDLLRALTSVDENVRQEAIYELFGNIWHQGTVYPATAAAVPFLYEFLDAPNVFSKSDIAGLLASIASGTGYLEVHHVGNLGKRSLWKMLSIKGRSLEAELKREERETLNVRCAASKRLPDLLPFLRDPESENRRVVAEALGRYPEHSHLTLTHLQRAVEIETDEEVQKALAESIDRLGR